MVRNGGNEDHFGNVTPVLHLDGAHPFLPGDYANVLPVADEVEPWFVYLSRVVAALLRGVTLRPLIKDEIHPVLPVREHTLGLMRRFTLVAPITLSQCWILELPASRPTSASLRES